MQTTPNKQTMTTTSSQSNNSNNKETREEEKVTRRSMYESTVKHEVEEVMDPQESDTDNNSTDHNMKSSSLLISPLQGLTNTLPLRVDLNSIHNRLAEISTRKKHRKPKKGDSSTSSSISSTTNSNRPISIHSTKLPRVAMLQEKKQLEQQHNDEIRQLTSTTSKNVRNVKKKDGTKMRRKTTSSSLPFTNTARIGNKASHERKMRKSLQPCAVLAQGPTQFNLFSTSVNASTAASVSRYQSHPYAKIDWEDEESICTKFPYIPTKGVLSVPKGLVESRTTWLEKAKVVREWRSLGHVEQVELGKQWTNHRRSGQKKTKSASPSIVRKNPTEITPRKLLFQTTDTSVEVTNEENAGTLKAQDLVSPPWTREEEDFNTKDSGNIVEHLNAITLGEEVSLDASMVECIRDDSEEVLERIVDDSAVEEGHLLEELEESIGEKEIDTEDQMIEQISSGEVDNSLTRIEEEQNAVEQRLGESDVEENIVDDVDAEAHILEEMDDNAIITEEENKSVENADEHMEEVLDAGGGDETDDKDEDHIQDISLNNTIAEEDQPNHEVDEGETTKTIPLDNTPSFEIIPDHPIVITNASLDSNESFECTLRQGINQDDISASDDDFFEEEQQAGEKDQSCIDRDELDLIHDNVSIDNTSDVAGTPIKDKVSWNMDDYDNNTSQEVEEDESYDEI